MRLRLRARLRYLRESSGKTQSEVADSMDWSLSKIIRIESGATGVSITDIRALLFLYSVRDTEEVDQLVAMARAAKQRSWLDRYKKLIPQTALQSIAYENSASLIRNFESNMVPALLQTEEYAFEALRWTSPPEWRGGRSDRLVELILERQERVFEPGGPHTHFIIDEAILARTVGSPGVMSRQLARLKELADHPNITLRVIPFTLGLYRHFATSYVIYEFSEPDHDLVLYRKAPHHTSRIRELQDPTSDDSAIRYLEDFYNLEVKLSASGGLALIDANTDRIPSDRSF